jgi:hypothetical protein
MSANARGLRGIGETIEEYITVRLKRAKRPTRNCRTFLAGISDWKPRKLSQLYRKEVIDRHREVGSVAPIIQA